LANVVPISISIPSEGHEVERVAELVVAKEMDGVLGALSTFKVTAWVPVIGELEIHAPGYSYST